MKKSKLQQIIKEVLENYNFGGCGCSQPSRAPILNENFQSQSTLTERMKYHIDNNIPITENIFRYGSDAFLELWNEARQLHENNVIILSGLDERIITEMDLGKYGIFEGKKVPLDLPMMEGFEEINEAEYQGKKVELNKPKRGGSSGKKYYVYVMDKGKVKKVSFGDSGGLSAKINDPKARQAFAKRHKCAQKKDKTKASYWSCRLPRYAKALGLKSTFTGYW